MNSTLKVIELKTIVEEIELISVPDKNLMWPNIVKIYDISPHELINCLLTLSSSPESQYYIDEKIEVISNLSQSALMEVMLGIRQNKKPAAIQWELIKSDCINFFDRPMDNYYSDFLKIILSQISSLGFNTDERFIESTQRWQDYLSDRNNDNPNKNETVEDALNSLIDYIKKMEFESEYEFFSVITDQISFFPPAEMASLCRELFKIDFDIIREGTLLLLLHKNISIRDAVLLALADAECIQKTSPIGLRRLISIRNWLNISQRSLLDDIIKDIRRCNTQCAALYTDDGMQLQRTVVTSCDGVGASSIFCSFTHAGKSAVIGAIIKENVGIIDTWVKLNCDAEEFDDIVHQINEQIPTEEVNTDYLEIVLPHFLWLNVQSEEALSPEVLLWMEWIGLDIYHPQPASSIDTLKQWENEQPELFSRSQVNTTFQSSAQWFIDGSMTQSWFETDSNIEQVIKRFKETEQDFDPELVNSLLAPHRSKWQERFFFLALRAKPNKNTTSNQWSDFALISKLLAGNEPLINIPAMAEIAINTLSYHNCEVYPSDEEAETSEQPPADSQANQQPNDNTDSRRSHKAEMTQAVSVNNWGLSLSPTEESLLIASLPALAKQGIEINIDFLSGYMSAICASPSAFDEHDWFSGILDADLYRQTSDDTKNCFAKYFQLIRLTIECHQPSISCELSLDYQESLYRPLPAWCQGFIFGIQYTGGVPAWSNYWPQEHQEMLRSAISIIKDIADYDKYYNESGNSRAPVVGNDLKLIKNCYAAIVHATAEGKQAHQEQPSSDSLDR